jgi:hypothetical protein
MTVRLSATLHARQRPHAPAARHDTLVALFDSLRRFVSIQMRITPRPRKRARVACAPSALLAVAAALAGLAHGSAPSLRSLRSH